MSDTTESTLENAVLDGTKASGVMLQQVLPFAFLRGKAIVDKDRKSVV